MAAAKKPERKDPKRRALDGGTRGNALINRDDENWRYCYVPPASIPYYRSLGYEVATYEGPGTCRPVTMPENTEPGTVMTHLDQTLMRMPADNWEDLQQYGADGESGQALFDQMEAQLNNQPIDTNGLRGIRFEAEPGHGVRTNG